jgi:phospholipid transport system substrate-binding protein
MKTSLNTLAIAVKRRDLLGLGLTALFVGMPLFQARADTAENGEATAPVQRLDDALLAAMKAGRNTPFTQRYAALAPVIEQMFDLNAVVATAVGLGWSAMPDDHKTQLGAAFTRYSVASYTANFDSYTGQKFELSPTVRNVGDGAVIMQSKLVAADGSATRLDYVMRRGPSGWKAIDVLADGIISRVAVQRSEFSGLLRSGGAPALTSALQRKVASLSGGMLA